MVNRPGSNLPLEVSVDGRAVKVNLAKDATGAPASTAKQVADAIEASASGLIDRAHPYRTSTGAGIVQATATPIVLTDFPTRSAPARRRARSRAARTRSASCGSASIATAPSRACSSRRPTTLASGCR
jgi:hypothetical protein